MSLLKKLLEKIIKQQLEQQINNIRPLSSSQHGFQICRSTLSNLLTSDSFLTDLINKNQPFDIISFDFKRAFNKVLHTCSYRSIKRSTSKLYIIAMDYKFCNRSISVRSPKQ